MGCRNFGLAVGVAMLLGGVAVEAAPLSNVTAGASYGSASDGPDSHVHGDPGSATAGADAGPGGYAFTVDEGVDLYDGASARARSSLVSALKQSSVGSYSHAGGYSPGFAPPLNRVEANSTATLNLSFIVHAPAEITQAQLTLELGLDGSLLAASYGGASQPGQVYAGVAMSVDTQSSLGNVNWFDASAELDRFGGLTTSGPWAAAFANATSSPFAVSYVTADYNQEFIDLVTVPTNEVFTYVATLSTWAYVHGPFENWAVSDFFNTGTFDLTVTTPGLVLERLPAAVPLPPAFMLLAAPLAALGARRRHAGSGRSA
ncbi:MAG: hypothetical protein AB7Q97_00700 [Gammaproteobacteria bacterium]